MLKISGSAVPGQAILRLAGSLAGDWVGELKRECRMAYAEHGQVILDFADVVFVDRAGAALVRSFLDGGISLINCSPFITEQLKQSAREKDTEASGS